LSASRIGIRSGLRLNGVASIDEADPLLADYPGAQLVVCVETREVFPNCPRYIHRYELAERFRFVPRAGSERSDGLYALVEIRGPEGDMPPLHVHHREDETFYVLERI